jgi:predicted cupin superfamily sugar epimerase
MLKASQIKEWLKMAPNTQEGGFFASVYQSSIIVPDKVLTGFKPTKHGRSICSAIYYLLESPGCSVLHRVTGHMIYHFYDGDPVQMLLLHPETGPDRAEVCVFGNNLAQRQQPMKVIPGGTWLGSRLMPGGSWALMGVTMAPGFDPVDYSIGERELLIKEFPEQADLIRSLTRASEHASARHGHG